jgi:hypothetical protein
MTWCELFAVFAALSTYRTVLRDCCALFLVDNKTDVHVLNRQATRSARLAGLLRQIFTIAVENNVSIHAAHRPGEDNVVADFLSRPQYHAHSNFHAAWERAHPSSPPLVLRSVYVVNSQEFGDRRARP